jgi:O-antigen/teichoic acid export membrane protein
MLSALRNYIYLIFKPFTRAHTMFVSSSALVMVFPMISAPIVARLYTPEDFGVYAVFFALATILSATSSLELRNIALLEVDSTDAAHGAILALSVVVAFCLALLALVLAVPDVWIAYLFGVNVLPYLAWLPATVLLMGASQVLYTWATRQKEYKILARNKFILGLSTMLLQIGIGLVDPGAVGFIIANLFGLVLAFALLMPLFIKTLRFLRPDFTFGSAAKQFLRYYRLTTWTMPGSLINSLSQFLPDLLINRLFGAALLGQYSLAMRMLSMPIAFLSVGIQDFFRQQASAEFNNYGHCKSSFWRFMVLTIAVALFIILPIILWIPYIFPVIFGSQWTESGTLIQALVFLTILRFISSPISYVWIIQGKQRLDFLWQLGLLGLSSGTLFLPPFLVAEITLYSTLWVYSLVVGTWYMFAIYVSYRLCGSKRPN